MGRTMAEKILAGHSDMPHATAGEVVTARLDLVHLHDANGRIAFDAFERLGAKQVFDRERRVRVSDHFAPAKDTRSALALKAAGISCVVAQSFARIFYRNAINIGLAVMVAPDAVEHIVDGILVTVDMGAGSITADGRRFACRPVPPFIQDLMDNGGLDGFVRERLASRARLEVRG